MNEPPLINLFSSQLRGQYLDRDGIFAAMGDMAVWSHLPVNVCVCGAVRV